MMSSCLAMPREGHLQQVLHIFAYLKRFHNSRIIMDRTYPDLDKDDFPNYDLENHIKLIRMRFRPMLLNH